MQPVQGGKIGQDNHHARTWIGQFLLSIGVKVLEKSTVDLVRLQTDGAYMMELQLIQLDQVK
jgi:hypothetical protein